MQAEVRNRLKIKFIEHDFSNSIFQKSITGQHAWGRGASKMTKGVTQKHVGYFEVALGSSKIYQIMFQGFYQTKLRIKLLIRKPKSWSKIEVGFHQKIFP